MKVLSIYSHTLSGLFWFDLPLAILLSFIFHTIVRDSLFDNLPGILNSRVSRFKQFDWNNYFKNNLFVVTISVLIGAASHIFWDSFTHHNGYFVQTIPALRNTVDLFGSRVPCVKILQHSSTLLGRLAIAVAFFKLTPEKYVAGQLHLRYWVIFTILTLIILAVRFLSGLDFKLYGQVIVTAISALLISLTLTSLLTRQKS
jgi:hypothetical protein